MDKREIVIATPCFGGLVTAGYMNAVVALMDRAAGLGARVSLDLLANDALISRARASLVASFLDRSEATHLLFVDADIGFAPDQVFRLIESGADVVAGVYPIKRVNWDKARRAIEGKEPIKEHLLITRYNPNRVDQGQMLSLEDIQDILRIKLIGVVPESEAVLQASNQGLPAIHLKGTDVSEAYLDVVARFLGEDKPLRFVDPQKAGLLKRLFGRK